MEEIRLKDLDQKFKYDIATRPGAGNFTRCFTCGTCTAVCPVAEVNEDYDPRKLIRMSILGMRDEVLSSDIIWMCQRCYACYARCPQNVKFADILGVLRDMAIEEGHADKAMNDRIENLDRFVQDVRCKMVANMLHPSDDQKKKVRKMVEEELVRNE
ncbi:4Fe-4S dicluster domain-containing protein [bacterium]|nr:4Fe-4S dicluster domain-containing protein [bacterium]